MIGIVKRSMTLVLCCAPLLSPAQTVSVASSAAGLNLQWADSYRAARLGLNWQTAPLWHYAFKNGVSRLDLTAELGVAYWQANHDRQPAQVWQLNAIPLFRYWADPSQPVFWEFGIGPTMFSQVHFSDENISTAYQFGDHLGVGYQTSNGNRWSLRLSHFSNADMKKPNPGLNLLQVTYTLVR